MQQVLTDALVDRLKPGVYRDARQPGFMVRVGKRSRTFRFELAYAVGDSRKTISQPLGSRPMVTVADARAAAAKLDTERRLGKVPASRRTGVTLGQAADEHFETLRGRWKIEARGFYRKHLSHWAARSLASLSDAPEEIARWHRDVTKCCG